MAPVVLLALLVLCLGTMLLQASEVEVCDVNEKGAVGDGVSDNTVLLQSLIDDEGCTELYFPSGNTYVSGSLFLRSNLVVTIDGTLFASPDYKNHEKWPLIYTRYAGFMRMMTASLLNGGQCKKMKENWNNLPPYIHGDQCAEWDKLENVTIKGSGNINGNGANSGFTNNLIYSAFRPTLLGLTWITGLTLTDLRIENPTFWTIHVLFCTNVYIARLDVNSVYPVPIHNGDGIDPDSSSNVLIEDCSINTNDDVIAIKSGKNEDGRLVGIPSSNITVRNMFFEKGHGIAIGTEMSGGVSDVVIENIRANGTDAGVKIKSERGRGGVVQNVLYSNIQLSHVPTAIIIQQHYHGGDDHTGEAPTYRNITLRNITADSSVGSVGQIDCLLAGRRCIDMNFENVDLSLAYNQTWTPCAGVSSGSQMNVFPPIPCI